MERTKKRPQRRRWGVYWPVAGKAKWKFWVNPVRIICSTLNVARYHDWFHSRIQITTTPIPSRELCSAGIFLTGSGWNTRIRGHPSGKRAFICVTAGCARNAHPFRRRRSSPIAKFKRLREGGNKPMQRMENSLSRRNGIPCGWLALQLATSILLIFSLLLPAAQVSALENVTLAIPNKQIGDVGSKAH